MVAKSLSETWNRYDSPAPPATLRPWLPMAASWGVKLILVCSNNGTSAIGADTFKLEPSGFKAAPDPVTALGSTGDRIPPSHAIAAAAHITIATFLNSIRYSMFPLSIWGDSY